MTTGRQLRSFAITLAIAIIIVGPRASGFTIKRAQKTPITQPTDLSTHESIHLLVKDDLRRPNDIASKNEDNKPTVNETKSVTENLPETSDVKTEESSNYKRPDVTTKSTTESNRIPTISSDTVEVFDSAEDVRIQNKTEVSTKGSIKLEGSDVKIAEENNEKPTTHLNYLENSTDVLSMGNWTPTKSEERTAEQTILSSERNTHIGESTASFITNTVTEIYNETEATEAKLGNIESFETTTALSQTLDESSTLVDSTSVQQHNNENITVTTILTNFSNLVLTTTESINVKSTEPLTTNKQKYSAVIKQKATSAEEITTRIQEDVMNAETSQINLETAFNITVTPSSENLRADLLSNLITQPISNEISSGTEKVTREIKVTTPLVETSETKKLEAVETKRAGYLDNSQKGTASVIASTSEETKDKVTETYGTSDNNVSTDTPAYMTVSGSESQSQLAEGPFHKEVFSKEEALNNHDNDIRYQEDKPKVSDGSSTEDSLSVQPIERTKTTLYTLGPNYKPMKKIDVQPAKPFVRDPDDNSWRNESISSLGIVFKAKNSSKSFKEVLKNKTQSELNNFIERNKEDVPDLRVRLEKITEVRKTKKKKLNKDGEVVYTDYEENSAETASTFKPDRIPTGFRPDPAEVPHVLTTPNVADDLPTKINLETTTPLTTSNDEGASKEKLTTKTFDIFSRFSLDALTTTQKPRKIFNIADYYDTTDEYDADYVTMSKIDLKKFTVPLRTSRPAPFATQPPAERRPTLQYFPPRDPPPVPVNVDNEDRDFERKVNMFTFKEPPTIRPVFLTAPPHVATEEPPAEPRPQRPVRPQPRPEPAGDKRPDIRPTVKPTDFMYRPAELDKNFYLTNSPPTTAESLVNDGRLDRGSYVIKHYKDFLDAANDAGDLGADPLPYHTADTPRDPLPTEPNRPTFKSRDEDEDYDLRFRKEALTRFVDNFNQNSERFKVDFPILYNNSVVHRGSGAPASSRAYLRRLYEGAATRPGELLRRPCEPHCELTVELSPAYELHYYVPNQEERQPQEPRTTRAPHRYGL